jgi:hypothetical protein
MDRRRIVHYLNEEWEKVRHSPAKIHEFFTKHHGAIEDAVMFSSTAGGLLTGLNPQILIFMGFGELATWSALKAIEEKKKYGGSFWDAGMNKKERLGEVI